jgi:hypothetical protein
LHYCDRSEDEEWNRFIRTLEETVKRSLIKEGHTETCAMGRVYFGNICICDRNYEVTTA